jgi:Fur family peroxide stress response transcriptional regulator
MKERNTKQKDFVHSYMEKSFHHPTAADIAKAAKDSGIRLGLTSAYRILNQMVQDHQALMILTEDGLIHYDCLRGDHMHFVCKECGKIIDLKEDSELAAKIKAEESLKVDSVQDIVFYGTCPECLKKKRQS